MASSCVLFSCQGKNCFLFLFGFKSVPKSQTLKTGKLKLLTSFIEKHFLKERVQYWVRCRIDKLGLTWVPALVASALLGLASGALRYLLPSWILSPVIVVNRKWFHYRLWWVLWRKSTRCWDGKCIRQLLLHNKPSHLSDNQESAFLAHMCVSGRKVRTFCPAWGLAIWGNMFLASGD